MHFMDVQRQFSAHIRNPAKNPAPTDIEPRRMAIYSELFFNNVQGLIASSYPVLHKILSEEKWLRLLRGYFANHVSHTPLFPQVPQEFLNYLKSDYIPEADDPAFMLELAHYEWVELALMVNTQVLDFTGIDSEGDLLTGKPILSPLAWALNYQFPVHALSPDYQPAQAPDEPTYIVVYRDKEDEIGFVQLNTISALLMQKLIASEGQHTGEALLQAIATEINHPDPAVILQGGQGILQEWCQRDIILGMK